MSISRLSDLADASLCRRLVIKVGSALLVEKGEPRRAWLEGLVDEIAAARGRGQEVVVVSSGAIALGAVPISRHADRELVRRVIARAKAQGRREAP